MYRMGLPEDEALNGSALAKEQIKQIELETIGSEGREPEELLYEVYIEDIMETMVHKGCEHISMEQSDLILFALRFLKSNLDEEVINTINGEN
jgi:hypothetical protein